MRAFYKQSLWILQNFLLTNPDLHHGLLGEEKDMHGLGMLLELR